MGGRGVRAPGCLALKASKHEIAPGEAALPDKKTHAHTPKNGGDPLRGVPSPFSRREPVFENHSTGETAGC